MYQERYKEFKKIFDRLCYEYDRYNVFYDFVKLAAISMQNVFIRDAKLEEEYLNIIGKYNKETAKLFPELFATLALMYEERQDICDILGQVYEQEGIANKYLGQFFTPFHVSKLMTKIAFEDTNTDKIIQEKGYITMSEPTCGAGRNGISCCKCTL